MIFRTFRTIRRFLAPAWLTEEEGELVGYSLDLVKDAFAQRAYQGLLAGYPQNGPNGETAPEDALTAMGRDRRLYRGIEETAVSYAARLVRWLDEWRTAGTAFALMKQLHAYCDSSGAHGCSFRTYDVRGNCFSRSASGVETYTPSTVWDWDGEMDRWARFWVVIHVSSLWAAEDTWGSGVWGDIGGTWGTTVTLEQAATLRSIVADWKPEGTRGDIVLALEPGTFDPSAPEPDGTWGKWYFGADAPPSRLATGRYSGA